MTYRKSGCYSLVSERFILIKPGGGLTMLRCISLCVRHVYRHPVDAHVHDNRLVLVVYSKMATSRRTEAKARANNDLITRSVTPTELIPQVSHLEATLIHGECYIRGEKLSVFYNSSATHSFLSDRAVSCVGLIPESLGFSLAVHTPASQSACAHFHI
ncbi:hypothetical protein PIB30_021694 [Stylosanthes scabra]|uniref:Uncharacterized protein n=1 Tax=Stylosanthes scabra TaxID=79078 RepID=A0ABU6Q9P3_9FABA|nr:hypothetical protein [Stylosanthes scabra]